MVDIFLSILSKTEESEVETVVLATFEKIISLAVTTPSILAQILKSILTGSGNIAFEKTTGSTIVQRFLF